MTLLLPDLDRAFQNFNYSELDDPTLSQPIPQEALLRWVCLARKGDPEAGCLFTDALRTTLREGTFDCFQRVHGPRAIGYRDWFYLKLSHFLGMLLYVNVSLGSVRPAETDDPWTDGIPVVGYGGPAPDLELLEAAFLPSELKSFEWSPLVNLVLEAGEHRWESLQTFLAGKARVQQARASTGAPKSRDWSRTRERNQIIRSCLERGYDAIRICEELDKRAIPTLPSLQKQDIHRWVDGWSNLDHRPKIQQVFSKHRPRNPVNSL